MTKYSKTKEIHRILTLYNLKFANNIITTKVPITLVAFSRGKVQSFDSCPLRYILYSTWRLKEMLAHSSKWDLQWNFFCKFYCINFAKTVWLGYNLGRNIPCMHGISISPPILNLYHSSSESMDTEYREAQNLNPQSYGLFGIAGTNCYLKVRSQTLVII